MEYVKGLTIDEKLTTTPDYFAGEGNFEKLFVQLLRGLKALHAANVVYLDLKPENVMLTQANNDVKIIDLGFCLAGTDGYTAGTNRCFAAPELSNRNLLEVDARTDIYSLGQLMLEPIVKIPFDDFTESIPAFICIIMMPLTYSISNGILLGMISYVLINLICGNFKRITPTMYILATLFILKYIFI